MRDESNQEHFFDGYSERLVVLAVIGRTRGCSRARLLADLDDIEPQLVERAIASLEREGVVYVKSTRVYPSAALQRLDDLTMICI
jgi:DNA-binding MarR family transcriptional regulator